MNSGIYQQASESLRAWLSLVSSLAMLLNQTAANNHNFKSKLKAIQGFPDFSKFWRQKAKQDKTREKLTLRNWPCQMNI